MKALVRGTYNIAMVAPSNSSFIPKRGPAKKKRKSSTRQVYIFTYISYILMFSTLLATGGVYFYKGYVERQLNEEITALNQEIASFNEGDMQRVTEFDQRLQQAEGRLDTSVSIASVFDALEASVIDSVQILDLNLTREDDSSLLLDAAIETDTFDSTIFQRFVFKDNDTLTEVEIIDVQNTTFIGSEESEVQLARPIVTFTASLNVPVESVLYDPTSVARPPTNPTPITLTPPSAVISEEVTGVISDGVEVNNSDI